MKRHSIIVILIFMAGRLTGQIIPLTDLYFMNPLNCNPAVAGSNGALNTVLQYRNQWIGFNNAPKNYSLLADAPLSRNAGTGFFLFSNHVGNSDETTIMGNYAYRSELSKGTLAFGLGFGGTWYHVNWKDLEAADPDDEVLLTEPVTAFLPDFSIGAYYYSRNFYAGFSLPFFLSHEFNEVTGKYTLVNRFNEYRYYFSGGCTVALNPGIKIMPAFMAVVRPGHAPQFSMSVRSMIKDRLGMGVGYRNKNIFSALLQVQVNKQFNLAYAYDYDLGPLGEYKNGSHELALNYLFSFERKVTGPRQF